MIGVEKRGCLKRTVFFIAIAGTVGMDKLEDNLIFYCT